MASLYTNYVEIDLEALRSNLESLKSVLTASGAGVMPVIKSDAYGHGMVETARVLEGAGVWGFGISDISEGEILRRAGIATPLLLLSGIAAGSEEEVLALDLTSGVADEAALERLEHAGEMLDAEGEVHLKVDTGMNRLGFEREQLADVVRRRERWPRLRFSGLFTHLSTADEPDDPMTWAQLDIFSQILSEVQALGWNPGAVHVANSAGLLYFPASHYSLVRPGLALYGSYPGGKKTGMIGLKPLMSMYSRVAAVRTVPRGAGVSYGHTYVAGAERTIAVVPVGYDDGYMRSMSNRSRVLIHETRCRVVGNICMKAMMVDVSGVDGVRPGDEVVLLGRQGDERITIEELAGWAGTVSYELLCLLGTRNQRIFKGADTCSA